jgi:methylglyoxal synthase
MLLDLEQEHFFQIEILDPLHASVHMVDIQTRTPVIRLTNACTVPQIMTTASAGHSSHKHVMISSFPLPAALLEPLLHFIESLPIDD